MAPKPFYLLLWNTLILVDVVALGSTDLEPKLHFTHQPQDVVVTKNERLLLNCSAVDDTGRDVNITWRKDGEVLNDRRRYVLADGSLLIKRVLGRKLPDRNDEGVYECLARNTIGTIASRKFRIQIANLSPISGEPQSSTVSVGELVRFQCQVEGSLPPPDITWEKHRQPLPQDSRYTILTSGVLQISDVQLSDAGHYRCHIKNMARERHSIEATLTVVSDETPKVPVLLATGAQHMSTLQGDSVIMECAVTAIPSLKVVWTHIGNEITDSRITMVGQGNLRIENVQVTDSGAYQCWVVRPGQGDQMMGQASLRVLVAPKLIYEPEDLIKDRAHTTRFICGFSGTPKPTVRWLKNGQPIEHNGRVKINDHNFYDHKSPDNANGARLLGDDEVGSMLALYQSMTSDSGLYQCQAENEAGQVSATVRLYVAPSDDSPDPPRVLGAMAVKNSSNKINLTWTASPPKNHHVILAYSVHYYPTAGGAELQKVITGTSVTIDQLTPHTNYSFYVVSYNEMSASERSPTVTEMTGEDVPVSAPEVVVQPVGSTRLKVTWTPLLPHEARGVITQYKVVYQKHNGKTEHHQVVSGNVLEYTITGLESNQKYDVRVVGGTHVGFPALDGQEWLWETGVTDRDPNTGAPGPPEMQVQALNSSSILVIWAEPPLTNGVKLKGYMLQFGKENEKPKTVIRLSDHNGTNHILTGLDGDSWYIISLHALSDDHEGEPVVERVKTPRPSESSVATPVAPPSPQQVEAEPLNATAIAIQWKKPAFATPVTSYSVRYSAVIVKDGIEDSAESRVKVVNGGSMKVVIVGLDPFTLYEFSVRSHTSNVVGQYGSEIRSRTLEGMPSAPVNPKYVLQPPSAVQLRWDPPVHKNGIIEAYIIYYRADDHKHDDNWLTREENGTMTEAIVEDLESNRLYFFKLRAATRVGRGEPSSVLQVEMRNAGPGNSLIGTGDRPAANNDKEMGIIVGACIGGGCIIICAIIILLRNKCFPPRTASSSDPALASSGHYGNQPYMNGNGYIPNGLQPHHDDSSHEMDRFLTHMTTLAENEHSDSKGGSDVYFKKNGRVNGVVKVKDVMPVNGLRVNGLRANHVPNGRVPNGRVKKYLGREGYNSYTSSEDGPEVPLRSTSLCEGPNCLPGHRCHDATDQQEADITVGETAGAVVNNGCSLNETNVDVSSDCGVVDMDTCSTDCEAHSPQDCNSDGRADCRGLCPLSASHSSSIAHQGRGARAGQTSHLLPSTTSHSSVPSQCLSQVSSTAPPPLPHKASSGRGQASGYDGQQQQQQQGHRPQELPSSQAQVNALQQQQPPQPQHLSSFFPHRSKQVSKKAALPQSRSQGPHCQRLSPKAGVAANVNGRPYPPHNSGFSQDNADLQVSTQHSKT